MPFNGSGVFQRVRNWVADAAAGIKIRADYHDNEDDGFAAGLTNCITKDGQTIITQNIPFNSKRVTGLADPVNAQDAATKAYTDTKLPASGGSMTGDITITKTSPNLIINSTDGTASGVMGQKSGKLRWWLRLGNDAVESGGNVGSDLDLHRYADDGSYLGQQLTFSRRDGIMTFNGAATFGGVVTIGGSLGTTGNINAADVYTVRGPNEGVIFLGSNGAHHLHYTGSYYNLPNGILNLGGQGNSGNHAVTWDQLQTKQPNLGFTPVQQSGGAFQQGNKVYVGWDGGGLRAQVDGTDLGRIFTETGGGPYTGYPITNARLATAGDAATTSYQHLVWAEPFGGAVMTGWESSWGTGYPIPAAFRFRYMQMFRNGGWFTVGYA